MIQEWHHLKVLKCSGCDYDPTGVKGIHAGECAILCPACPQPDINLSVDWRLAPSHKA